MPGIDETQNFFRVRLRDPGGFTRLRQIPFKRSKPRIFAVVGRLSGESTTTLQSLLFPKEDGWNRDRVKEWMDAHPDVGKALAVLEVSFKDLEAERIEFMPADAEETRLWEQQVLGAPVAAKDGSGYDLIHKTHGVLTKQVFEDDGEADIVISTSAIDRDREVVRPEGMKIFKPKRIPLVASHAYGDLRKHIGEIKRVKAEGEDIVARARYFIELGNGEADWGWTLVKLGVPAYSIGFKPFKWEDANLEDEKVLERVRAGKEPLRTFTEWELLEVSHVIVPSQREAVLREVAEAVTKGVIDQDLAARISRAIEEAGKAPPEPAPAGGAEDILDELLGEGAGLSAEAVAEHYAVDQKQGGRWVVSGARGLPLLDDAEWDAGAAVASWRRAAGAVTAEALKDRGAQRRYRRGFLVYNAAAPDNFGSYKFPFVKVDGGRAKASRRGLIAARVVLAGGRNRPDIPANVASGAARIVDSYLGKPEDEGKGILPAQATLMVRLFEDGDRPGPDAVLVLDEDGQAVFRGAPVDLVDALERAAGGPGEIRTSVTLQVGGLKIDTAALEEWSEEFAERIQAAIETAVKKAAPNFPPDSIAHLTAKDLVEKILSISRTTALQVVAKAAGDIDAYRT